MDSYNDMLYKDGMYKHVFHKGIKNNKQALARKVGGQSAPGLSFPNNARYILHLIQMI